jgi:ketosteroid isomerase-like protein
MAIALVALVPDGSARAQSSSASVNDAGRAAIMQTLESCIAGWNDGDLERFLAVYEDTPFTTLITGPRMSRGLPAIRERYSHFSHEPGANGILSFELLEFVPLGRDYALLTGRGHLTGTDPGGMLITMLFHQTPVGWRIVNEHAG